MTTEEVKTIVERAQTVEMQRAEAMGYIAKLGNAWFEQEVWKESALRTLDLQRSALMTMANRLGLKVGDDIATDGVKALDAIIAELRQNKADHAKNFVDTTARVEQLQRERDEWKRLAEARR